MQYIIVFTCFVLVVFVATGAIVYSLHKQRDAVMQHFSLSAARVGAAFAQGGGQSLPEFVRNCCLDHACRLMVEHPTMSFVEVGEASGYQRATTFYHDFKARFGMTPAEYREKKLKN